MPLQKHNAKYEIVATNESQQDGNSASSNLENERLLLSGAHITQLLVTAIVCLTMGFLAGSLIGPSLILTEDGLPCKSLNVKQDGNSLTS